MYKLILLIISVVFCLQGCALENIPMVWRPTNDLYHDADTDKLSYLYNEKIKVMPFVDQRQNPKEIGKNIESSFRTKLVTTKDDVAQWCTDRFMFSLSQFGIIPVTSGETLRIYGEVVQFYVNEDNRYRGNVGIKLIAQRPDGKIIWQGMMVGSASRLGRSYKDENYYEVLSDSFIQAFQNFMKNDSLAKAIGER